MSKEDINEMQGKGQNLVDEAYFFDDPNVLRQKYIEHMEAVTINVDINNIDIKSPEYLELEKMYQEKEAEVENFESRMNSFEKRLSDIDNKDMSRKSILEHISEY